MNNSKISFGQRTSFLVVLLVLFVLHLASSTAFLHRVPGLLGDEGSEGENVWQILDRRQLTVVGERSYIGPLIDYLRIPFILSFGYSALALRMLTLFVSLGTFGLAWLVFRRWFGPVPSLYILTFIFFSPTYILYQRLGWAITLIPFFTVFILWLLQRNSPWKYLWVGLAAGLGLHNHFIFLPTLLALMITGAILVLFKRVAWSGFISESSFPEGPTLSQAIVACGVGFLAGFGTQFAVMMLQPDDQGSPTDVVAVFFDRLQTLPTVFPALLSGSTYSALYTGTPYPHVLSLSILVVLAGGVIAALAWRPHRPHAGVWLLTVIISIVLLILIIDRHAVRYYVPVIVGLWGLAGWGYYKLVNTVLPRYAPVVPLFGAGLLLIFTSWYTLFPYLQSGGNTVAIPLHAGRSESAAAYVDVRPLVACLEAAGPAFSENVHIYNRLLYLSRGNPLLAIVDESSQAQWLIDYRENEAADHEHCPLLRHFTVMPNTVSDNESRDE